MAFSSELQEQIQHSLDYRIYWSCFQQLDEELDTGWRILPYWVLLYTHKGETRYFQDGAESEQRPFSSEQNAPNSECHTLARAGELLLIPAGVRHRLLSTEPTICDGLHINFRLFQGIDLLSLFEVPLIIQATEDPVLYQTMQNLTQLWSDDTCSDLLAIATRQACVYTLLQLILTAARPIPERERPLQSIGRIQNALSYIDEHPDHPIRVETLASYCSMSRNRFSLLFKEILGQSPQQYLTQKRLARAMSLLANSEQPISVIAETLSFCDQFHFSKWFKKVAGESPRSYRDKIRAGLFR